MTLDELKRLRERLDDPATFVGGIGDLVTACIALLDREIERETPLDGPFVRAVEAGFKTNQGGGGEVSASASDPEGVEDLIRQRDEARREAEARSKTIVRMAEDSAVGDAECSRHREEIARLTKERDDLIEAARPNGKPAAKFMRLGERFEDAVLRLAADRDALKAALDVAEKECDRARIVLGAYDSLDGGYGSRDWIQFHDARRAASRAKEGA